MLRRRRALVGACPPRVLLAVLLLAWLVGCQPQPAQLLGRVLDGADGTPLAGVSVAVLEGPATQTDEDGRFALPVEAGSHVLRATREGYAAAQTSPLEVQAGGTVERELALARRMLEGQVRDAETHAPLTAARVELGAVAVQTDGEGAFALEARELATLTVEHPLYLPETLPADALRALYDGDGRQHAPLVLELSPRTVAGVVRDAETGAPLAGAIVRTGGRETLSDAQGRVALDRIAADEVLTVEAAGYHATELIAGEPEIEAALAPWRLTLVVREAGSGAPLAGAQAIAPRGEALTDDEGRAALPAEPGQEVVVSLAGYRQARVAHPGDEATVEVLLEPAYLSGRLTDAETGAPIADALVLVHDTSGELHRLHTDADGAFEQRDLQPMQVLIKAPGYRRYETAADGNAPLEVALAPFEARGIYIPFGLLTLPERVEELLDMVAETELNAVVVDVKSDRARLAWESEVPLAQEMGAYLPGVMPVDEFLRLCHERDIYVIARMVVFKDDLLARARPDWAVRRPNGELYQDLERLYWVDPFRQQVRDYNVALALEVAALGFDEIQVDYIRFPSDGASVSGLVYSQESTLESRTAAIAEFSAQLYEALRVTPAYVSADIFGLTMWVDPSRDMGIGQRVEDVAAHMDYISPMLYPSTFGPGNLGYDNPALYPYEVVQRSVAQTARRTTTLVRPWLQAYSYAGVEFDLKALLKQRQGAEDAGSRGWLYWHAGGRYDPEAFMPGALDLLHDDQAEEAEPAADAETDSQGSEDGAEEPDG